MSAKGLRPEGERREALRVTGDEIRIGRAGGLRQAGAGARRAPGLKEPALGCFLFKSVPFTSVFLKVYL